VTKEDDDV